MAVVTRVSERRTANQRARWHAGAGEPAYSLACRAAAPLSRVASMTAAAAAATATAAWRPKPFQHQIACGHASLPSLTTTFDCHPPLLRPPPPPPPPSSSFCSNQLGGAHQLGDIRVIRDPRPQWATPARLGSVANVSFLPRGSLMNCDFERRHVYELMSVVQSGFNERVFGDASLIIYFIKLRSYLTRSFVRSNAAYRAARQADQDSC